MSQSFGKRHPHCATLVVSICRWQINRKLIMYHTKSGKNSPLYLYPHHGPSLKIFAFKGSDMFMLCSRFGIERSKITYSILDFFSDWNFAVCKYQQIRASIAYTWPGVITVCTSSWIVGPNRDFDFYAHHLWLLAVATSCVFLLLIVHLALSNGAWY